jgi:predicted RNase H-like HicB family nuclease
MRLEKKVRAVIKKFDGYYVASCLNINVVTQGDTFDETLRNLQEAVALYLEGEDLAELGLAANPAVAFA